MTLAGIVKLFLHIPVCAAESRDADLLHLPFFSFYSATPVTVTFLSSVTAGMR